MFVVKSVLCAYTTIDRCAGIEERRPKQIASVSAIPKSAEIIQSVARLRETYFVFVDTFLIRDNATTGIQFVFTPPNSPGSLPYKIHDS